MVDYWRGRELLIYLNKVWFEDRATLAESDTLKVNVQRDDGRSNALDCLPYFIS